MLADRPTRPTEFSHLVSLLPEYSGYTPRQVEALPAFWRDILARGAGHSAVVFDTEQPNRVLAFGISCFIDSRLATEILEYRRPLVARGLLERWSDGHVPFLLEAQVAGANAAGDLIVLITHSAYPAALTEAYAAEIRYASSQSFVSEHRGLNLRGLIAECLTVNREYVLQRGAKIREFSDAHETVAPGMQRPFLCAMMRDDTALNAGNFFTDVLFHEFVPPRMHLDRGQRELLKYALVNDNDEWIAEQLGISPSAVKKRWLAVYGALSDRRISFSPRSWLFPSGQRGPEKRRHVLRYVRQHPEELHPYDPRRNLRSEPGPSTADLQLRAAV